MFRVLIAFLVGAGFLLYFGWNEFRISRGTTAEAAEADLAKIEKGEVPANNHLRIGQHIAVFPAAVYSYSHKQGEDPGVQPETILRYAYYPLISVEHPFVAKAQAYLDAVEAGEKPTPPEIGDFTLLVKTYRYKRFGELPTDVQQRDSITGMMVHAIERPNKEERDLIQQSFPQLKPDKILVLQEERRPSPLWMSLGMMGGGVALIAVCGVLFFRSPQ